MLRVYDRFAEVDGAEHVITLLDDRFGKDHAFLNSMSLKLVAAKTALPKNVPLQKALNPKP